MDLNHTSMIFHEDMFQPWIFRGVSSIHLPPLQQKRHQVRTNRTTTSCTPPASPKAVVVALRLGNRWDYPAIPVDGNQKSGVDSPVEGGKGSWTSHDLPWALWKTSKRWLCFWDFWSICSSIWGGHPMITVHLFSNLYGNFTFFCQLQCIV